VEGVPIRVLVVDDEESLRHMLSLSLSKAGYHVWTARGGEEALSILDRRERFDICLTDVRMPGMDGLALVEHALRSVSNPPTFVAMSAYGDEQLAVEALRRGAFDYISKPFEATDLQMRIRLLVERRRIARQAPATAEPTETADTHGASTKAAGLDQVVSASGAMQDVFRLVRKVASFPTTVLITGETGTGKERIAQAIHAEGRRAGRTFVPVNCAAIPPTLLETELFGHARGAFTDASSDRAGLFEAAHEGTLFLDEVAELPTALQVKLLRALVEHEIRRVGDSASVPIDVRVVAATSRDLARMVREGHFREDLFYRLNVLAIHLPPLRERPDDIPVLAEHFVHRLGHRLGFEAPSISDEAMRLLADYAWPGNVRELENAIERALVLSEAAGRITLADLDDRFEASRARGDGESAEASLNLKQVLPRVEADLIRRALERTGGNRTKAATLLGISPRALLYKLKDYGIS